MLISAKRFCATGASLLVAVALGSAPAHGQAADQFGIQSRTDAARQMIVVAIQQGISSLPPTSGQSFTYRFDEEIQSWQPTERLGPTSFRVPETIGQGNASVRVAGSYFDLDESFGPADYRAEDLDGNVLGFTKFGLDASARVGLFNLAANYGVTNRIELFINVPVVVTNVQASQSFLVALEDVNVPLADVRVSVAPTIADVNALLKPSCTEFDCLRVRSASISAYDNALRTNGFTGLDFNEGTNSGVGRISIGGKALLYDAETFQVAFMPEFFLPSPSEAEFAGSDTPAILPRVVGAARLTELVRFHLDAGYDYDFEEDELRRFTWNVGSSLAFSRVTVDFGVGGSKFNSGITWTPDRADFGDANGNIIGNVFAVGDNTLGDNFVDFLGGVKYRLTDRVVISGAVNVPLNDEGFRAAAVGTLAAEIYF